MVTREWMSSPLTRKAPVDDLDALLRTREAATLLGLEPGTLEHWRWRKIGPPYIKLGNGRGAAVRYSRTSLVVWLAESRSERCYA